MEVVGKTQYKPFRPKLSKLTTHIRAQLLLFSMLCFSSSLAIIITRLNFPRHIYDTNICSNVWMSYSCQVLSILLFQRLKEMWGFVTLMDWSQEVYFKSSRPQIKWQSDSGCSESVTSDHRKKVEWSMHQHFKCHLRKQQFRVFYSMRKRNMRSFQGSLQSQKLESVLSILSWDPFPKRLLQNYSIFKHHCNDTT